MTSAGVEHKSAGGAVVEAGQAWAYRARRDEPLAQVRVVRVGVQRPARVLVRFADEAFEGRQEWVPPGRLKARWERADEFRAREARWDAIDAAGPPRDDPREGAAEAVIELLFAGEAAELGYLESGAIRVRDPAALAARLGLDPGRLTGHPLAFTEDGVLIAPWEVTELIVTTAARLDPQPVLEDAEREERQARREAVYGRWYRGSRGRDDWHVPPEHCAEADSRYSRPRREVLRAWCGAEAAGRFDELAELRQEVRRIGEVAQSAIRALSAAGQGEAVRLQRELGIPLGLLKGTGQSGGPQALSPRGMNSPSSDGPTSSGTR
jgi:hypothetical protein